MDKKNKVWEFDREIEWKKIPANIIDFYFNQAEKKLEETTKTFENTSKKTHQILLISISIITISLRYLLNSKTDIDFRIITFFTSISGACIIIMLRENLFYDKIGAKGSSPENLIKKKFIQNNLTEKEKYNNIILNECIKYQERIKNNREINSIRKKRLEKAISLFLLLPISVIVGRLIADILKLLI
ncbi:hypothetical protein [Tenacibaculum mesophilum]|uniref:hypothetical protein n=1 Tax=Tenacibaculum mesophilum TaxID=104268 RepID=UPI00064AEC1B|nr:hypothetical protein [Tenacibaculum mesophilum]